jgi:hypothetical protein
LPSVAASRLTGSDNPADSRGELTLASAIICGNRTGPYTMGPKDL